MTNPVFHLDVTTEPADALVRLRLSDTDGRHLAAHQVRLAEHGAAKWEGVFDTRSHVRRYTDEPEELLERIGVFLGRDVLGPELTAKLWDGLYQRTLLVRLPDAADDPLAAAFARVPWEIARVARR